MSFSALYRLARRLIAYLFVFLMMLVLLPGIPPHVTFTAYELPEERPRTGALAPNGFLDGAERLLEGQVLSPESIASRRDDELFLGVYGGGILRVGGKDFDQVERVADLGRGCEQPWHKTCGFPLGMRFAPDGRLVVVDAVFGIFSVNVDTGEQESLFDITKAIDGAVPGVPNDLDIDAEGNIYWSDASTVSDVSCETIEMFSDPNGRLVKYDQRTETNTVLAKNIHFANGIQLSPRGDFVLVTETFRSRVLRHWLNGPRVGTTDVFVDQLPGFPDNIRGKSDGGYYVSLVWTVSPNTFDHQRFLARLPWMRKLILRTACLVRMLLDAVSHVCPNDITRMMSFQILNLGNIGDLLFGKDSIVVELDANGNIVGSLQGEMSQVWHISETKKIGNYLFFGSPYNTFLGRLHVGTLRQRDQAKRTDKKREKKMNADKEL